jgi:DNA-binding transcriptional MerR regulator/uncharacterized protein (DUF433 family)
VTNTSLLAVGIYTIPEASRLTGVSTSRIRRWLKGYDFKTKHDRHHSAPVWRKQLDPLHGSLAVGFKDLMEIRFIDAFLDRGVSWKTMRAAHAAAQQKFQTSHPFCTNKFATDGRSVLLQEARAAGDKVLLNLANNQQEFECIVTPFLKELEFTDGTNLVRWWPLGRERQVVVDPARNFGQPSAALAGVPTRVLSRSVKANGGSIEQVALWYEITPMEVRDAIEFEHQLAA